MPRQLDNLLRGVELPGESSAGLPSDSNPAIMIPGSHKASESALVPWHRTADDKSMTRRRTKTKGDTNHPPEAPRVADHRRIQTPT
eukprot:1686938-Rhodomonas_salina.1